MLIGNPTDIEVVFAYYGISCADGGNLKWDDQRLSTQWAASLCDGKTGFCSGRVTKEVLGNPYPGCSKDFFVINNS